MYAVLLEVQVRQRMAKMGEYADKKAGDQDRVSCSIVGLFTLYRVHMAYSVHLCGKVAAFTARWRAVGMHGCATGGVQLVCNGTPCRG